ncbi:MAG: hypothetical protein P1P82_10090 [Bacteroidales bacterium]|nr:hypothetical protein [Bacteroidales bacterium]
MEHNQASRYHATPGCPVSSLNSSAGGMMFRALRSRRVSLSEHGKHAAFSSTTMHRKRGDFADCGEDCKSKAL